MINEPLPTALIISFAPPLLVADELQRQRFVRSHNNIYTTNYFRSENTNGELLSTVVDDQSDESQIDYEMLQRFAHV